MIDDLGGVTAQLVRMSLDAASLRHMAIASNIANVNSQDYTPVKVNFEEQLEKLRGALLDRSDDESLSARLAAIQPRIEQNSAAGTSTDYRVSLDMEMVKLAQNVVHYQSLLKGLANKMAVIKLAVNEGRR
jgi:flagellar basal-body rod protein FlgB